MPLRLAVWRCGGMGLLTRKYGLSCDSLISADVVTADGRLLVVNEHEHPDLFWAWRGEAAGPTDSSATSLNRTGFVGGPIQREDGAHGTTQQVLPGAA
jgi:hypothetical protein